MAAMIAILKPNFRFHSNGQEPSGPAVGVALTITHFPPSTLCRIPKTLGKSMLKHLAKVLYRPER